MFCLDDYDVEIFGTEQSDNSAFIDFVLLPCNVKESAIFKDGVDRIDPECVHDLDKQEEYIGAPNYRILANSETF